MVDLTDREVEVEALMARLGYERYWSDLSRAKEKGEYALRTDTGRHLLREMVWKVAERIELWFKEAKKAQKEKAGWQGLSALSPLQEIGADVAALLTCKCLLDNLTVRRSFQAMLMGLGYRLEDELLYRQVRKEARQLFDEVLRKTVRSGYKHRRRVMLFRAAKAGLELKRLPPRLLGRMALVASECAFEASGMFERENRWNSMRRRIEVFVHVKPEVLEWCEQSEREHEMLHPFYMPTVEEPLDWEGLHGGGYHTDIVFRRPLVKFFRWRHEKLVAEADYTRTAMAVNVLQHVPW